MATYEGFLEYARIDDPTSADARICYDAAVDHARSAGLPDSFFTGTAVNAKFDMYVYRVALGYYDHRDDMVAEASTLLTRMRTEMRYNGATS